jgi:sec-independent protein translocase protein TatB
MFDLSLAELAFIAVVALVVIGPKELPVLLRAIGRWIGRFKRFTKAILHQLELDELNEDVKIIQNDAGQIFDSYDLSGFEDSSRKEKSGESSE